MLLPTPRMKDCATAFSAIICAPGTSLVRSRAFSIPSLSSDTALKAVMAAGDSWMLSLRLFAVTTISSICWPALSLAGLDLTGGGVLSADCSTARASAPTDKDNRPMLTFNTDDLAAAYPVFISLPPVLPIYLCRDLVALETLLADDTLTGHSASSPSLPGNDLPTSCTGSL